MKTPMLAATRMGIRARIDCEKVSLRLGRTARSDGFPAVTFARYEGEARTCATVLGFERGEPDGGGSLARRLDSLEAKLLD